MVGDVVAVGAPAGRAEDGRRVQVGHPDGAQVADDARGLLEAEPRRELEAVRRAEDVHRAALAHHVGRRGEELERASHERRRLARRAGLLRRVVRGVDEQRPGARDGREPGDAERHVLRTGVHQEQQVVVDEGVARLVGVVDAAPREEDHQAVRPRARPVVGRGLLAVGAEPEHVAQLGPVDRPAPEEIRAVQGRVLAAEAEQLARELPQRVPLAIEVPVDPADLVVLTVRVVVPALRAPHLVAREEHRGALREEERREQVAPLAGAEREDARVRRRALDAAVPPALVVVAVAVLLAVRLVVLRLVGHEVVQRRAVVRGDEVDARGGLPAARLVQIAAAREAVANLADAAAVPPPERPHRVAEAPVPLGPAHREVPDLVAALADVPRLGDELHVREVRRLVDQREERRQLVDLVELSRERRREVEAEAVDVHLRRPVPQGVHDEREHLRVPHVQRVAGAGEVEVVPRVARDGPVVGRVVDSLEVERRPEVVALGGVVVDDVEDDLDARAVERLHHGLELGDVAPGQGPVPVPDVGGEEGQRVVAPVVAEAAVEQVLVVGEAVDRHQLDRGDAEVGEVVRDRRVTDACVRAAQLFGHLGVAHRQAADVRFVEDGPVEGRAEGLVTAPVEGGIDDDAAGGAALVGLDGLEVAVGVPELVGEAAEVPPLPAFERPRVRVEEQDPRVEPQPARRVVRAADPERVPGPRTEPRHEAVPHEGRAVRQGEPRLRVVLAEDAQLDGGRVLGIEGEVDPFAEPRRAERSRSSGQDVEHERSAPKQRSYLELARAFRERFRRIARAVHAESPQGVAVLRGGRRAYVPAWSSRMGGAEDRENLRCDRTARAGGAGTRVATRRPP